MQKQKLAILGATGSIGRQTIEVALAHKDLFSIELITAHSSWKQLAALAVQTDAATAVVTDEKYCGELKKCLADSNTKAYGGEDALLSELTGNNIDTVVVGISGFAGLKPTIAAIRAGKKIALANKETLVVGGDLVIPLSKQYGAPIIPVDSEHSAIFQCLAGEVSPHSRLIITASGGALRDVPKEDLDKATPAQVLKHPSWDMGPRVTVDSATMLNKGFEIIEAHHLFSTPWDKIDVVIHPESIIHSMVEFEDGAVKAQMGMPDMRIPIQYALSFPHRLQMEGKKTYTPLSPLTFREVDFERYPCLGLAYECMKVGGSSTITLNAAGEIAVRRFLAGEIPYTAISGVIAGTLDSIKSEKITTFEQIFEIDSKSRKIASGI